MIAKININFSSKSLYFVYFNYIQSHIIMKRTSKGQPVKQQPQIPRDQKVAQIDDKKIIYPLNLEGKTFTSWSKFWNQLNADRDNYMHWYKLEKIDQHCTKINKTDYYVKCRMCKSEIKIQSSGQKPNMLLKVFSVNNIHNHTKMCFEIDQATKKQARVQKLNEISDIFLVNNSYQVFKVYKPQEMSYFKVSEFDQLHIHTSSENNKKQLIYSAKYSIMADDYKIGHRVFPFPQKTKKELDLIAIAFALCDCYYLEIPSVKIICSIECSKLCSNSWQSQILQAKLDQFSMSKFKIIKKLESKFVNVQFIAEQQENLLKGKKPTEQNIWKNEQHSNPQEKIQKKLSENSFINIMKNPNQQQQYEDPFDFLQELQDASYQKF